MKTITIPAPAQYEVRCDAFIGKNNLDAALDDVANKYSVILDRVAEPQDADGNRIGDRVRLPTLSLSVADLPDELTAGGITVSKMQFLLLINELVDMHKAQGLTTGDADSE
jgi:hypothetical protein